MAAKTLVLVPTEGERKIIEAYLQQLEQVEIRLAGFGLLEAALVGLREIEQTRPENVMLCGIAGSLDVQACPVGATVCFRSVTQFGIGCQRETFLLPQELGFNSLPTQLELMPVGEIRAVEKLVSVAGSGIFPADQVRFACPGAVAEDMEGFGLALAASLQGIRRISIVRSISNAVGEPFSQWAIADALHALGKSLQRHFVTESN